MARRRIINVFSLSFLDAMTCGLGAVVLLYLLINAGVTREKRDLSNNLSQQRTELEQRLLNERASLVETSRELQQSSREHSRKQKLAESYSRLLSRTQAELNDLEQQTLVEEQELARLKRELKTLEVDKNRMFANLLDEKPEGDRVRSFIGDGDRQYLTGLRLGGKRIMVLVDQSASMLDETIVNIIRRRNMTRERKIQSPKWQQTLRVVDWLSARFPQDSYFQIYTFAEQTQPLLDDPQWLPANDAELLEQAHEALSNLDPGGGTNLASALSAVSRMDPLPDNLILITDGLPTRDNKASRDATVKPRKRLALFERAIKELPQLPVNVILLPMEGDPMAAAAFWKLTIETKGSFLSPPGDWP